MKLLFIQLARSGDILQSIPALRAYKRCYPYHEVHVLVRKTFSSVCELLPDDITIHILDVGEILSVEDDQSDLIPSLISKLEDFLDQISKHEWDIVVNATFSPLSSWITAYFQFNSQRSLVVRGYSRYTDGFLSIPDDLSAYFYAQVGIYGPNRFHLCDLFATLLGVDLDPVDWIISNEKYKNHCDSLWGDKVSEKIKVALHPFASSQEKSIPKPYLRDLMKILTQDERIMIWVVHSPSEHSTVKDELKDFVQHERIIFSSSSSWAQNAYWLQQSDILIAVDSSIQNLASLVGTKVVLLPFGPTKFWETGPRTPGSFIIDLKKQKILPTELYSIVLDVLGGKTPHYPGFIAQNTIPSYFSTQEEDIPFEWDLCEFIYRGKKLPKRYSSTFILALEQIGNSNQLFLDLMKKVDSINRLKTLNPFFKQLDEVLLVIQKLCPEVSPIIRWFQTERIRIGPDHFDIVFEKTFHIHNLLQNLIEYILDDVELQSYEQQIET